MCAKRYMKLQCIEADVVGAKFYCSINQTVLSSNNQIQLNLVELSWRGAEKNHWSDESTGAIMKIFVHGLSVNSIAHRRSPVYSSSLLQCDLFTFMVKWGISCVTRCEGTFLGGPATSQTSSCFAVPKYGCWCRSCLLLSGKTFSPT